MDPRLAVFGTESHYHLLGLKAEDHIIEHIEWIQCEWLGTIMLQFPRASLTCTGLIIHVQYMPNPKINAVQCEHILSEIHVK